MKRFLSLTLLGLWVFTGRVAGAEADLPVDVDGDGKSTFGDRHILAWWLDETGVSLQSVLAEGVVTGDVIDLSGYFERRTTAPAEATGMAAGGGAAPESAGSRRVRRFPTTTDGNPPDGPSEHARVTPDGRFFVFSSKARFVVNTHSVPATTFQVYRVQRRGDGTTETKIASLDTSDNPAGQGKDCKHASLSDNGNVVVFDTAAALAGSPDGNGTLDVYARIISSSSTVLVSTESTGTVAANGASELAGVSADSVFVGFTSAASDITGFIGSGTHVYRANRTVGGSGIHVGFDDAGNPINGAATADPNLNAVGTVVDADGDLVVYQGKKTGQSVQHCWVRVLSGPGSPFSQHISISTTGAPGNGLSRNPSLASHENADDNFAVFSSVATNFNAFDGPTEDAFFVYGVVDGPAVRRNLTAGGNGASTRPMLTSDGELVTFTSAASNLVAGDGNGVRDVFLADLDLSQAAKVLSKERISVAESGSEGNNTSETSDLSDGGFVVVFESDANNLIASDGNSHRDVFESSVELHRTFRRGDVNNDGSVNISDVAYLTNYLNLGGPPPDCMDAADVNDDGKVNISDPAYLANFLNLGGPPPPAPGPSTCGSDPTSDALGCEWSICE